MDWLEVTIPNGRTAFAPGEEIEVSAVWRLDEVPDSLEVRLFWFTEGKGDRDTEVIETEWIDPSVGGTGGTSGHRTCRFQLPDLVPSSFSGKLVSLLWAIELVAESGSRAGRVDLIVSPTGKELRLYGDGPDGGADASAG